MPTMTAVHVNPDHYKSFLNLRDAWDRNKSIPLAVLHSDGSRKGVLRHFAESTWLYWPEGGELCVVTDSQVRRMRLADESGCLTGEPNGR